MEEGKYLLHVSLTKGLYLKQKITHNKKHATQLTRLEQAFPKRGDSINTKRCSTSLVVREMKLKAQ